MNARRFRRSLALLLVVTLLGATLPSQEATFSSNVKVVNVLATVRAKNGAMVCDLKKEDFELKEDGRPQTIRYFSQESDLPLTLGLLVDTSLSQRNVLDEERTASFSFLNNLLREDKDQAFVIHFDFEVELLQDLTSSRQKLEAALNLLEIPERPRPNFRRNFATPADTNFQRPGRQRRGGQRGGGGGGIGTLLYDAVFLASHDVMKPQRGRKALIILSDGQDYGSQLSLQEGVEAAQRSDTVVYSILFTDGGGGFLGRLAGGGPLITAGGSNGKKVLQRISQETGGRMFEVSRKLSIAQIYAQIEEELRNQYSLGYSSDQPAEGTAYRKITLQSRQKDLIVQTRDGYYPHQQLK
ncbi:MAG: VWA domain-containing protein [Terriglobales bacterium]